ncbi:MAG TPA: hypothetical protein VL096_14280, partial [Pirellulaceae bacterium]|nr:hypothetical protein [Pirellulaceae bacterium]
MAASSRRVLPTWSLIEGLYRVIDAACILIALMLVQSYTDLYPSREYELTGAVAVIIYLLAAEVTGVYRSWRGISTDREILCAWLTWGTTLVTLLIVGFATRHTQEISRFVFVLWAITTPVILGAGRMLLRLVQRTLRHHGVN